MKKRLFFTLFSSVLLMLTFAEQAQAYYNPAAGGFINRALTEERGWENATKTDVEAGCFSE